MRRILLFLCCLAAAASSVVAQQTKFSSGATLNVGPAAAVSISITPSTSQTVAQNATQAFLATVTNDPQNQGVGWNISGTGFNCIFPACGTITNASPGGTKFNYVTASGASVTYQAPPTIPAGAVTITATSLTDQTKFVQVQLIVISSGVSPPFVVNAVQTPAKQTAAAANTYPLSTSQGNGYVVGIGTGMGATITSVTDPINGAWTSIGCQADFNGGAPGVHVAMFYIQNANAGVTSVTVNETGVPATSQTVAFYDLGNASPTSFFVNGACNGTSTATANPVSSSQTVTAAQGQIVITYLSPFVNCSSVANPFIFGATPRGDATAYAANQAPGSYAANWTCASGSFASASALFQTGTSTGINVSLNPTSASVVTSTTAKFTANVVNDPAGVNLTYTGAGCSGATCGSGPSTATSGTPFTYTAPAAVPSPATVTITAASITNPAKTATATVTITATPVINVNVTPANASTTGGGATIPVTAVVTNDTLAKGVTFAINPSCGSICGTISAASSASNVPITYTPPGAVSSSVSVTITATSVSDPTKTDTAVILVSPASAGFSCSGTGCPAFAGLAGTAMGAGALSQGGRGGGVYNITSLGDSTNAGCLPYTMTVCTLRDCVNDTANIGARICNFMVSGAITNASRLWITKPFITINGQTAPGGPITLHSASSANCPSGNCETIFISTHDVIVRYLTYDGFTTLGQTGPDIGTVGFEFASGEVFNVIVENVTGRWWGNKVFVITSNSVPGVHNISAGRNLLYEPNLAHPVIIQLDTTSGDALAAVNQDYYDNVGANFQHRWPLTNIRSMRWVNNVAYNPAQDSEDHVGLAFGALQGDYIGNVVLYGPQTVIGVHPYLFNSHECGSDGANNCSTNTPAAIRGDNDGPPTIYMLNNLGPLCSATVSNSCSLTVRNTPTNVANDSSQVSQTFQGWEGGEQPNGACSGSSTCIIAPTPAGWFRNTPLTTEQFPIVAIPSTSVVSTLLSTVGNSRHLDPVNCTGALVNNRDTQDARVIAEIQAAGSGTMFNGQFTSPSIAAGTPCTETLHDGIPDAWKTHNGLSTTSTTLNKTVDQAVGLTYKEIYDDGLQP